MTTNFEQIRSIFMAAIERPTDQQAAYLAEACGSDASLREQVDILLQAHQSGRGVLDAATVASGQTAASPSYEKPDLILADKYKLIERIGEGGMGSVWLAQQSKPMKRKVAVKLIKLGMDSRQVLQRFEAERQALAMMDHPNIAKVLDGGLTRDGRPFFVMELVKGTPITEYCDARKLSLTERLDLFVPVCQAIQHAHQKGIIHRDIKPSNVMIAMYDDRPVPKVIDFGVAKATGQALSEATMNTGFGGVIGTPQYMSPEQAMLNNLDIDTRSDVYSLGVLLYELLTGSPPFTRAELENKGLMEMLRVVREDEPPKPSTKLSSAATLPTLSANRSIEPRKLTQMLQSDLDWIVMKALEKNRARRYETANSLAADVQRYLTGEPVAAHPPSASYLMRKFLRRHRPQVVAASLVLLVLVAGIAGTTFGLIQAKRSAAAERLAKVDAQDKRLEAEVQQHRAEINAQQAARAEHQAAINAADAQYQLTRLNIATGTQAQERGEKFAALLWYARAWQGDPDPAHDDNHRIRLGTVLGEMPRLVGVCFHPVGVGDVDFSPLGNRLVTRTEDLQTHRGKSAYLWDFAASKLAAPPLNHSGPVRFVGFSSDGKIILTASEDKTAAIWDAATGLRLLTKNHDEPLSTAAFVPGGQNVATVADKKVFFWNPSTGQSTNPTIESPAAIYAIKFNRDGSRVVTSDVDGQARVWETATGHAIGKPFPQHASLGPDAAFDKRFASITPDGTRLLTFINGSVQAYEVDSGRQFWEVKSNSYFLKWSEDGNQAVISDATTRLVDGHTGKVLQTFKHPRLSGLAALSTKAPTLATGISGGGIYLWDTKTGKQIGVPLQCADFLRILRISKDGNYLFAASEDGTARVWELTPKSPVTPYQFDCGQANKAIFADGFSVSPDGATRFRPQDGGGTLERLKPGQTPVSISLTSPVIGSAFSGDGGRLVTLTQTDARVWDAATGNPAGPVIPIEGDFELKPRVEISNDGSRVAVQYSYRANKPYPTAARRPQAAIVWQSTGERIFTLPSKIDAGPRLFGLPPDDGAIFESAMSPDGRFLVTGIESIGAISTFDIGTGKALCRAPAFRGHLFGLTIDPASKCIAICSSDGISRAFDILTGAPTGSALRHPVNAVLLALNPGGGKMTTITSDGRMRLWDIAAGDLLAIAPAYASYGECWFSRDGSAIQFTSSDVRSQYRVPTYQGPKDAVTKATQLIAGRYMDSNGGISDLGPSEFLENREAYRKAWMDWQGLSSSPAEQP
jgi:serine/threonine protein kinase/WD40 repeat protein